MDFCVVGGLCVVGVMGLVSVVVMLGVVVMMFGSNIGVVECGSIVVVSCFGYGGIELFIRCLWLVLMMNLLFMDVVNGWFG